jgi:hypothetical protein
MEAGFVIGPYCLQPEVGVIFPGQSVERGRFSGSRMTGVEVACAGTAGRVRVEEGTVSGQ